MNRLVFSHAFSLPSTDALLYGLRNGLLYRSFHGSLASKASAKTPAADFGMMDKIKRARSCAGDRHLFSRDSVRRPKVYPKVTPLLAQSNLCFIFKMPVQRRTLMMK